MARLKKVLKNGSQEEKQTLGLKPYSSQDL